MYIWNILALAILISGMLACSAFEFEDYGDPYAAGLVRADADGDLVAVHVRFEGARLYDVSNPALPVFLSAVPLPSSGNIGIRTASNKRALLLDDDDAIRVYDITNPQEPECVQILYNVIPYYRTSLAGTDDWSVGCEVPPESAVIKSYMDVRADFTIHGDRKSVV